MSVRDLGIHRLKDLPAPERIYQLAGPGLAKDFPPLKSLGAASSLPVPATALVGREEDIGRLRAVLARPGSRLVTLTGAGGIGKTRLAVQAAAGLGDEFPDGLWWAALAPVSRGDQVLGAIAQVLGVREEEGAGLERAVAARLEGRRMLIVLDNAEHLLPEVADVVARLLAASDRLVVLATSRERLQLSAEHVYPVPPLPAGDAVALLRERAAAAGVPVDNRRSWAGCVSGWTGCRSRWNWPPRGCGCFRPRNCWTGSIPGWTCSPGRGMPSPAPDAARDHRVEP